MNELTNDETAARSADHMFHYLHRTPAR